jgi:putative Mn2+ efflux pump MntP
MLFSLTILRKRGKKGERGHLDSTSIILIALGLAMDAFAVSVTSGITIKHLKINHAVTIALFFGSFQALMPVVGWAAGLSVRDFIADIDHWMAFGLLSFIGCKMIYEAIKVQSDEEEIDPLNIYMLLMLSIATSIDALAVGISFAFLEISIVTPVMVIGTVTFILSLLGVLVGDKIGHVFENKIEILGGIILIGIGVKILYEHLR